MKSEPGSKRLICIDDDPVALDQLRRVISKIDLPLKCDYLGSPAQAIDAHRAAPADFVLSDLRLGSTTGIRLIEEMQAVSPETIFMLISGEADLDSALAALNEVRVFRFFKKPAVFDEIRAGLTDGLTELNLRQMRRISNMTFDAMSRLKMAVAVIDAGGKIAFANEPAREILAESGVFDGRAGDRVRAVDPEQTKKFMALLEDFSGLAQDGAGRCVFRFVHPDRPNPIVVSLTHCQHEIDGGPYFNMAMFDPMRENITSPEAIATALGLTQSEARIVHGLAEGDSVDEAAARAGVSVSTARTYLKTVFSKTGVSRQAELVRLALLTAA